jgi:mannose-6-phosphate isomerase-like protein (cupin superfamily)
MMIRPGDQIINSRTGQIMKFLKTGADTNGQVLQIDCISPPSPAREPEHIHPFQENRFEIISGDCHFMVNGKEQVMGPGQSISIPAKTRHYFWNEGTVDAHYIQEFKPALDIAGFFDTFFALSRDGKLNDKGIPNFFHASIIMLEHKNEIRLTNPPWPIQYLSYILLAPIGRLMGYHAYYQSKK